MRDASEIRRGLRVDPAPAFRFRVELDGEPVAAFRECHGLVAETEVFEFREGGVNGHPHRLPGRTSHPPLVLGRGLTLDRGLWLWSRQVVDGDPAARRTGDVVLCDEAGEESLRWTFVRGWPCRWEGPVLVAGLSAVAVEVVEIVHEGLTLVE